MLCEGSPHAKERTNNRHEEESQSEAQELRSPVVEEQTTLPDLEPIDTTKQAEKIKEQGNAAFKAGKFQEAIDYYTQAIGEWPTGASCTRVR
jgi:DnaJ homolog subfamily C member 7